MNIVGPLPLQTVDQVWPLICTGMERSCERGGGDLTSAWLWQECRAGRAFLVLATDEETIIAACIWRVETWAGRPVLKNLATWGERMRDWYPAMRERSIELAKACRATRIMAEGRTGWGRLEPKARPVRVLYEVDI